MAVIVYFPNFTPWNLRIASSQTIDQWISLLFSMSDARNWSSFRRSISGMWATISYTEAEGTHRYTVSVTSAMFSLRARTSAVRYSSDCTFAIMLSRVTLSSIS